MWYSPWYACFFSKVCSTRNETILALEFHRSFTLALLGFSTYQALVVAPTEQTMGDVQRIFYYHVPSAWVAGVCFFVNFLASIAYLWKRSSGR